MYSQHVASRLAFHLLLLKLGVPVVNFGDTLLGKRRFRNMYASAMAGIKKKSSTFMYWV